jgi:uncharacterized protein (TIGR00255 family)
MTGIGNGRARKDGVELRVEIRSVNHRFLDLGFRLPSAFAEFEPALRTRLQEEIDRGRVSISFELEQADPQLEVRFHEPFVKAFVAEARRIAKRYDLQDDLGIAEVARRDEAFTVRQKEMSAKSRKELLETAMDEAIGRYQKMRDTEGRKLGKDMLKRLKTIEVELKTVKKRADVIPDEIRRRIEDRLARSGAADSVDPQRLAAEITILVDKASVHEEIDRMESHLAQFREACGSDEPVAKRLGFLLQEMHREVNTTGSKSNDLPLTNAVMRMKEEIENMREQIQNLE